jgi:hypothetical protein
MTQLYETQNQNILWKVVEFPTMKIKPNCTKY